MENKRPRNYQSREYNKPYERNRERHSEENNDKSYHENHLACGHNHSHSLREEIWCHVPFALLSIIISFIVAGILFFVIKIGGESFVKNAFNELFHLTHYIHIFFASLTMTIWMYKVPSNKKILFWILGVINTIIFCTLSDIILPALGEFFLNNKINLHICFFNTHDLKMLLCFLLFGSFAGYALSKGNKKNLIDVTSYMHFSHILISSLSALFYIISHTSIDWINLSGYLLIILFFSVFIPCTISDFLLPYIYSSFLNRRNNPWKKEIN